MRYEIREKRRIIGEPKYAIFDENGKRISDWFDFIYRGGLVSGQSPYYLVKKDGKWAIFHKSGKRISEWCDDIEPDGLVKGQSPYYLVEKDGKWAIFHESGERITEWFEWINREGLVNGKNDFFIARKNGKFAVYHKSGKKIVDGLYNEILRVIERKIDETRKLLVLEASLGLNTKVFVLLCNNQDCQKFREFENSLFSRVKLNDEFINRLLSEITSEGDNSQRTDKLDANVDLPTSEKKKESSKRAINLDVDVDLPSSTKPKTKKRKIKL